MGSSIRIIRVAEGETICDRYLARLIETIVPALLSKPDMQIIKIELDSSQPREVGAPKQGLARRKAVANKLESLDRPDIQAGFIKALVLRLRSGKRITICTKERKTFKYFEKLNRDMLIRGLYKDVKKLQIDRSYFHHEILGLIKIKSEHLKLTRAKCTMTIVQDIMREKLNIYPPAIERMFNIVSHQL